MKAQITQDANNGNVTLTYDAEHFYGEGEVLTYRATRTFMVPVNGGYVRELEKNGNWGQVCDKLSSRGSTLMCSSREKLLDLIRKEYRAAQRADAVSV